MGVPEAYDASQVRWLTLSEVHPFYWRKVFPGETPGWWRTSPRTGAPRAWLPWSVRRASNAARDRRLHQSRQRNRLRGQHRPGADGRADRSSARDRILDWHSLRPVLQLVARHTYAYVSAVALAPGLEPGLVRVRVVKTLVRSNPLVLFVGSPLNVVYLRALGAKLNRAPWSCPRHVPVCTDVLALGAGAVVRKDSSVTCYRAEAGVIRTGHDRCRGGRRGGGGVGHRHRDGRSSPARSLFFSCMQDRSGRAGSVGTASRVTGAPGWTATPSSGSTSACSDRSPTHLDSPAHLDRLAARAGAGVTMVFVASAAWGAACHGKRGWAASGCGFLPPSSDCWCCRPSGRC